MKNEDLINLRRGNNPVLCKDGKLGMLLIYPGDDGLCGVQVHGEEAHRWISASELTASDGGALRERGSPKFPPESAKEDGSQMLLAMDWALKGGLFI